MRELKFRAWDIMRKVMHCDFQFIKSGDGGNDWIIPLKPITDPDWVNDINNHIREAPHFRQQFNIMQYTGLKDKNGKEIYEGDILKTYSNKAIDAFKNGIQKVIFRDGGYMLVDVRQALEQNHSGNLWWWLNDYKADIEVIGNIYENKELMEV